VPSALVAAWVVCTAATPVSQGVPAAPGSVTGRVTLTSRMRGVPISTNAYLPRAVTGQQPSGAPEMRSVVVYLKGVTLNGPLPATRAQIRQEHESFSPRVLAVTRGSTVDFPNFDPYFHNVFSLSGAGTFDLGRYPEGQTRSRQFTRPGIVKVYCHIHSHMSATILVMDHPHFATPDDSGTFSLSDVPPGDYTLVGWHERVGEQSVRVTIRPGEPTTASLSLPVEDAR
jgi:plastocyanin